MPPSPTPAAPRCAVVDLGSNSVRLVVFEGQSRNPVAVFNEKAVLRLGRGLQSTGRLNDEGVAQALTVMHRYHAIARAMGAETLEVLATAAVRDATNGPAFVQALRERMPDVPIHILSGEQEAAFSAGGLLCGIPQADGILADIGGGSLELVRLDAGHTGPARTLSLGVIRLAERAGNSLNKARTIAETDLAQVPWLAEGQGRDLYVVGGAWRALARIHMAQTGYPLHIVHHYTIRREEARDLTEVIASAGRRALERLPDAPRRRIEDLPYAAVVLRRLLRATGARRVVFSANGMREGWFMLRLPENVRAEDPLLAAGVDDADRFARDRTLPANLLTWTDPLFPRDAPEARRLRYAACLMSDIGSRDHPEFRAEQAFLRILRQPGIGIDHHARAFLALAIAMRYEAEADAPFLHPARTLLDVATAHRAEILGVALRLAYTLCAATSGLLAGTSLQIAGNSLILRLDEAAGVFSGESVFRRLDRLAQEMGLDPVTERMAGRAA
jgi:exopolyphosphatase / guanosine-5'-triphosphate,3'-diphosphate pyrophosphatase